MTDRGFTKIEAELGHPVPEVYRVLMLAHGEELRKAKEAMPLRATIYCDPNDVIHSNRFAREHAHDVFPIGPKDTPFPESYFMIGDNGGGDCWFIKRESPESGVWFYQCESHDVSKANRSLDDYLDRARKANKTALPWKTAMVTYEGMPLALRVRPNVDTPENRVAFPHLAIVTHELSKVKSNGLPESDYNRSLMQFDLDLQAAVSGANAGIVFLVETFPGKRNYYACVADTSNLKDRIEPIRASCPQHTITVAAHRDKAWQFCNGYRQNFRW